MELPQTEILFYGSIFITAILGIILAVFAAEHIKFLRRFYKLQEENRKLLKDTNREMAKVMEEAVASSEALINQARVKAQEIISDTKLFSDSLEHQLTEASENAVRDQVREYEQQFEMQTKQLTEMFQEVSKDIRQKSNEQIEQHVAKLSAELSEQSLAMKSKMEEYQTQLFGKVDEAVFAILDEVAQKVIGKSIDYKEHEQLVTKALVEAKHDHFIE